LTRHAPALTVGLNHGRPAKAATEETDAMSETVEAATMRRVFRHLIPIMFIMMFFSYLDRINISFAALQMNAQLGFSPAVFGFAGSIFFFGYMILQVPSNLLLHRVGARRWLAGILLTWGVVAAITAFIWDAASLYVMRFGLGLMEGGLLPGLAVYLTIWFPERYRARAVSGYIIAGSFAAVLGGPISTAVITYVNGPLGLQGWQWMFLLEGIPTALLGAVTVFYLTERPAEAHWLEPDQREWLQAELVAERARVGDVKQPSIWTVVGDIRVWALAALFGCALVGIYGLFLWLPQIVKSLGNLTNLQVGFLSAVPPLAGVLGTIVIGRSSDKHGERKKHLAFVYAMSAICIAASAYAPNPVLAYLLLCLTGLFIYSGNPLFWSLAASFRTGAAGAACIALINTIAQFGGLIGPWSIGLVRDATGDFNLALLTIAGFLVISVVIALAMPVRPPESSAGFAPAPAPH
jgi:MFS transporter, ACS family, tartrate transporter